MQVPVGSASGVHRTHWEKVERRSKTTAFPLILERENRVKRTGLADVLLETGVVSSDLLGKALAYSEKTGMILWDVLARSGNVDEKDAIQKIGSALGIPPIELKYFRPQAFITRLVPKDFAKENLVLPVSLKQEDGKEFLYCALADPTDADLLLQVETLAQKPVRPLLCTLTDLRESLDRFYTAARPVRRRTTGTNNQTRKPEPAVPRLFAAEAAPEREVVPGMLAVPKSEFPDLNPFSPTFGSDISSFAIPIFNRDSSLNIRRPTPNSLSESQIKPYKKATSFTDVSGNGSPKNGMTPAAGPAERSGQAGNQLPA